MTNADRRPTHPLRPVPPSARPPAPGGFRPDDPARAATAGTHPLSTDVSASGDDVSPGHRTPSIGTAHGLFIGVSQYDSPDYGAREQVADSARALAGAFTARSVWDMPQSRQQVLTGHLTERRVMSALEDTAAVSTQLLVVYVGGHGRRFESESGLHLALSDSRFTRYSSHLPFREIRNVLDESSARLRLLLVDSCYSHDAFLGGGDSDGPGERDSWTITATDKLQEAIALWRGTPHTALAGALLHVIEQGVEFGPEVLTVQDLFGPLRNLLRADRRPTPAMRAGAGTLPLFRNAHPRAGVAEPTIGRGERISQADIIQRVVNRTARRSDAGTPVVTRFAKEHPPEEIAELAKAFADFDEPGLVTLALRTAVHEREAADSAAVLHLAHSGGIALTGALLGTFGPLPADRCTALVRRLGDGPCPECRQAATGLTRRAAASGWSTADLVRLAAGLPGAAGTDPWPGGGNGPAQVFLETLPPRELLAVAAGLWAGAGPDRRTRRLRSAALAEHAARDVTPAELLELAGRLTAAGTEGAGELSAVLLESVAETAGVRTLATLLGRTARDDAPGGPGDRLRTAIVRRRPPVFLAALVRAVDAERDGAARPLLEAALRHATMRDLARALLVLRDSGPPLPAVGEVFGTLAGRFEVPELAQALVLLDG